MARGKKLRLFHSSRRGKLPTVPRRLPRNRHLRDLYPRTMLSLPSLVMTEIDRLLELAPPGTWTSEPERIVAGWLTKHNIPFIPQYAFAGGRQVPGGAVVDFIITLREPPIALRVNSFWHLTPGAQYYDDISKAELTLAGYRVEDIWEDEVRDPERLDQRMWEILLGSGL